MTLHYRQATDFRSNTCEQKVNLMPDSTAVLAGSSSFLETIHITRVDTKTKKNIEEKSQLYLCHKIIWAKKK